MNLKMKSVLAVMAPLMFAMSFSAQSADFTKLDAHVQKVCTDSPDRCLAATERAEKMKAKCAEDPAACEARRAKFEQRKAEYEKRCAENPEECAERKARHEERRKQCAADPEACKAKREERRAKCEANPEACKKWRHKLGHKHAEEAATSQ